MKLSLHCTPKMTGLQRMASIVLPTLMPGAPHNGGEHCTRCIVSRKSGLHHSRPIVAHQSRHFSIIGHCNLQFGHAMLQGYCAEYYGQQSATGRRPALTYDRRAALRLFQESGRCCSRCQRAEAASDATWTDCSNAAGGRRHSRWLSLPVFLKYHFFSCSSWTRASSAATRCSRSLV